MNKSKIANISLIGILIALICGFGLIQSNPNYQFETVHKGHVGYLDGESEDASIGFTRCSDKLPIGFYSSFAPRIYKGSKSVFRKYVQTNFPENKFSDTGFLNFRFLINCNGEIGDIETNQLDSNYEVTQLNSDLVNTLAELTFQEENWNILSTERPYDSYMYVIYKIENGNVVEILP